MTFRKLDYGHLIIARNGEQVTQLHDPFPGTSFLIVLNKESRTAQSQEASEADCFHNFIPWTSRIFPLGLLVGHSCTACVSSGLGLSEKREVWPNHPDFF